MPPRKAAPASMPVIELPPPVKSIVKTKRQLPDSITKKAAAVEPVKPEVVMDTNDDVEDLESSIKNAYEYYDWAETHLAKAGKVHMEVFRTSSGDRIHFSDIINFIWEHITDEHKSEFGCKAQLRYILLSKPLKLIRFLLIALDEAEIKAAPGRANKYMQANEAAIWVEEWLNDRKTIEQRLDAGEIVPKLEDGELDDEDCDFNINDCEEACGTKPDDIFDFIWEHIFDEERQKFGSRGQLEYVLSFEPQDLLKYLRIALDVAGLNIAPLVP